ncbi:TPA: phage head-tail connector protein [Bacillus cereus]|uniref:phage head-tail connector protein n=1 Tax=Bacillus cereus group TaxID=86661 RepID=UPI0019276BB1|nr:phage head-tail connector protein [Bacillus cereus]MBL3881207.1 phage head-tail connector protein [Bacillus cereus]HDR7981184.1 phage head-tail connector protein [Bacillus cereus]HDR8058239.1 phage head-tail connector protein [Bacillus cereus]HDR8074219.1 phage head-tail connector protein [Bacillus cereus]HDR8219785.1 phage head-tail connector protein [Bacillus cereus]
MDNLLDDLKDLLKITWNDEDAYLNSILSRGKAYLFGLTNASFDFSKEEWPKELLLERCRYVYNNAGDEFEKNYRTELSRLILLVALGKVGVINAESV